MLSSLIALFFFLVQFLLFFQFNHKIEQRSLEQVKNGRLLFREKLSQLGQGDRGSCQILGILFLLLAFQLLLMSTLYLSHNYEEIKIRDKTLKCVREYENSMQNFWSQMIRLNQKIKMAYLANQAALVLLPSGKLVTTGILKALELGQEASYWRFISKVKNQQNCFSSSLPLLYSPFTRKGWQFQRNPNRTVPLKRNQWVLNFVSETSHHILKIRGSFQTKNHLSPKLNSSYRETNEDIFNWKQYL